MRNGLLKIIALSTLVGVAGLTAIDCGKGITPLGPQSTNNNNNKSLSKSTVKSNLPLPPYAIWTPTGDILYCDDRYFRIIDEAGTELSKIRVLGDDEKDKTAVFPSWAGSDIVYQVNTPRGSEIRAQNAFGGIAKTLDFGLPEGIYEYPAISPDKKFIAFTFNTMPQISSYPPKGKATPVNPDDLGGLDSWNRWAGMYSWSSDDRLALAIKTEGTNIYVMENIQLKADNTIDVNSIRLRKITSGNYSDNYPSWSPDCSHITFDSTRGAIDRNLFIVNSDGTDLKNLSKEMSNVNNNSLVSKTDSVNKNAITTGIGHFYARFNPNPYNGNKIVHSSNRLFDFGIGLVENPIQ